ncbi:tyrosine-type recombinase/integrase [Puniceibacterium confluentis]|uniref:tyrosine-type recombinase/integrase n=1 Tax=Puniceibacterium confluentis TaxID=1958944 RepID=UPI0011B55CD1|nr:integrase arm-type DNA-binding domain-containing protein [Puniceibacterium confluentis]
MAGLTNISIKNAEPGRLSDGRGLILDKSPTGSGRWLYRYQHLGKRRDMGLGSWPTISLAQARSTRDKWAAVLADGRDPISVRQAQKDAEKAERDHQDPTFAEMVTVVFEARKASLRGDGTRGRWRSPLDTHVIPKIGRLRMSSIHQSDIKSALQPIWRTKHPTAEKALQRTLIVFREARAMGIACDPFVVDAAKRMLGIVRHEPTHIAATPWQDMPALYASLRPERSSHLCLRWMILTLVRADGCKGALASEVDGNVWTVPSDRIKGVEGRVTDFRVPLPAEAMRIVEDARDLGQEMLFPGRRSRSLSSTALEKALNEMGETGRPHGFRSSFRDWVQDTDAAGYEVSETILGHKVGNRVERSYARSDLLERRRPVMEAWARFVTGAAQNAVAIKC